VIRDDEALCLLHGHDYRDRVRRGPDGSFVEDGSYGWRACACGRSLPEHADAPADPAGGDGCGMVWRLCGRCDHIEELHVTDDQSTYEPAGAAWPPGDVGGMSA
jgi:hypothetical protein